jgi:hypothetical protein
MDTTMVILTLPLSFIYYILISIGLIPNPNPDWLPPRQQAARAAGTKGTSLAYAVHMQS